MKKLIVILSTCLALFACSEPSELIAKLDYSDTTNNAIMTELNHVLIEKKLPKIRSIATRLNSLNVEQIYFQLEKDDLTLEKVSAVKDALAAQKYNNNHDLLEIEYDGKSHGFSLYSKDSVEIPVGSYSAKLNWKFAKISKGYYPLVNKSAKLNKSSLPVSCLYEIPLITSTQIPDGNFIALLPVNENDTNSRNKLAAMMNVVNTRTRGNIVYFDNKLTLPKMLTEMLEKAPQDTVYISNNKLVIFLEMINIDMGYGIFSTTKYSNFSSDIEANNECQQIMRDMYPKILDYQRKFNYGFQISDIQINPKWLDNMK